MASNTISATALALASLAPLVPSSELVDRAAARAAKDWGRADEVRDILNAAGVQVTDVGGQATWAPGPDFDAAKLEGL